MTSRPMPVHSSGMEAVVEMTTVTKQKMNARGLVFSQEQVNFIDDWQRIHLFFHFSFLNIIFSCPQLDKITRPMLAVNWATIWKQTKWSGLFDLCPYSIHSAILLSWYDAFCQMCSENTRNLPVFLTPFCLCFHLGHALTFLFKQCLRKSMNNRMKSWQNADILFLHPTEYTTDLFTYFITESKLYCTQRFRGNFIWMVWLCWI